MLQIWPLIISLHLLRILFLDGGCPAEIYTDNRTNFVEANRELQKVYQFLQTSGTQQHMSYYLDNQSIWSELAKLLETKLEQDCNYTT